MKIPDTVKICGLEYKVIKKNDLAENENKVGKNYFPKCEITLQIGNYNPQFIESTFFHEVMHSLAYHYLNDELTEKQVDRLANGLYAFLNDNNLLKK